MNEHFGKGRVILLAVLILAAAAAFGYGIWISRQREAGWVEITAENPSAESAAGDFTLLYELEGKGATALYREISLAYAQDAEEIGRLLNVSVGYEEANVMDAERSDVPGDEGIAAPGLAYINAHPNETVRVDAWLYEALEKITESGTRYLYLGPVYEWYGGIFYSQTAEEASAVDPFGNEDAARFCRDAALYANDPQAVQLELLGEDQVRLFVSDEYLAFLEENDCHVLLDFGWMKNAFAADYLAEKMIARGHTRGVLTSQDGYIRCLDESGASFTLPQTAWKENGTSSSENASNDSNSHEENFEYISEFSYTGPMSIAYLRAYPVADASDDSYYVMPDGSIRTAYIDPADGLCRTSRMEWLLHSAEEGCADLVLSAAPEFIG
ncbi:MAG: hypothetical protein J6N77_01385 [Lachnospiraceae bacterium]|nr:hypothetical protein [Lachnospiraceae bacterium]